MPAVKTSRENILRAVWSVFHAHGYHDASLKQLADAAGLGKAGLLHHFGSKEGLMNAAIHYATDWYHRKVLTKLDGDAPLETRLGDFLDSHFKLCQLNGGAGCFFANTILETGVQGQFTEALNAFHTSWKAAVERLLEDRYGPEEARERTYRLFVDYQGSVIVYKLYQDPVHLARFRERALHSLQLPIN